MTIMRTGTIAVALLSVVLWCGAAAAQLTPEHSLYSCQLKVKVEAAKFIKSKELAITVCLQSIAKEVVGKNGAGDVGKAAATCVTEFRKISDSRGLGKSLGEKFTARVTAHCDPTQPDVPHTLADILGTGAGVNEPLNAENIGAWCARFGGNGSIATFQDWMSCIQTAAECSVDAAISTQYPRALEWLDEVKPEMEARTPPSTDLTKVSDAVNGLDAVRAAIGGTGNLTPTIQCGWNRVLATGQTDSYGPGSDGDVQAGVLSRYVDNGDGTITDLNSGLMWEKKSDDGSIHDTDNTYGWCLNEGTVDLDCDNGIGPFDGTLVTEFLSTLNTPPCFAGHCDWRLPNIKELQSLVNYQNGNPAVDTAFNTSCMANCTVDGAGGTTMCSCTRSGGFGYSSSTTWRDNPGWVWNVNFGYGNVGMSNKALPSSVRAVRGGL